MSYRALFNWINPWVFFPHTLGYPIFEILFFAYLGRFAERRVGQVLPDRKRVHGDRDHRLLRDGELDRR